MGIKETAESLVEKGTSVLDANGDGTVEASEVIDAMANRAKETAEAVVEAADEVKKGFDADGDGSVSLDEIKVVAEGIGKKASEAFEDLKSKFSGE